MADVFSIAEAFKSRYEDEGNQYYNKERDTWTAYPDELAENRATLGPGLTGQIGGQDIIANQEYPANLVSEEFKGRSQGDYDLLTRNIGEEQWGKYNPNQQAAVMSLLSNVGYGNLSASNAFRHLKEGNIKGFTHEAFDPEIGFVKAESGGPVIPGLAKRRGAEMDLFNTPYEDSGNQNQPIDDLMANYNKVNDAFTQ